VAASGENGGNRGTSGNGQREYQTPAQNHGFLVELKIGNSALGMRG
jgi:hypothetical protein